MIRFRVIEHRSAERRLAGLMLNEPRTGKLAWFSVDGDGDLELRRLERFEREAPRHSTVEIGPRERSEWTEKARAALARVDRGCDSGRR